MTEPTARVVLDLGDSRIVHRALEDHATAAGRILVWPTPGAVSRTATCEDVRTALGLPFGGRALSGPKAEPSMVMELRRRQVEEAFVLRAHRLTSQTWAFLGHIAVQVPLVLSMVLHRFGVASQWRAALSSVGLGIGRPEVLEVRNHGLVFTPFQAWRPAVSSGNFC